MKIKNVLAMVATACLGAAVAIIAMYRFCTAFIDEMLTTRFSSELAQDIAMYFRKLSALDLGPTIILSIAARRLPSEGCP